MQPVREFTIVRISFNLSPQERQLLFVSLSMTATFSARNNSTAALPPNWVPGIHAWFRKKPTRIFGREATFGTALPFCIAHRLGQGLCIPVSRRSLIIPAGRAGISIPQRRRPSDVHG